MIGGMLSPMGMDWDWDCAYNYGVRLCQIL